MKNVGMKPESYRVAEAQAILYAPPHCIELLRQGNTEKGDALKTARVAGILAAKRTDELIPLCHPLPIYRADVEYELEHDFVKIVAVVETIGPTGVEMEALTAASLAGLTIYDMLKPHCEPEELWMDQCKLLKKKAVNHTLSAFFVSLFLLLLLSYPIPWQRVESPILPENLWLKL